MAGRSGGRNWVPGLFAAFWILLAVFSGAYLFRIVTEPHANQESASASPAASSAPSAETQPAASSAAPSSLSADQAQALIQSNQAKDQEIGELKTAVRDLSGQVSELSNRLKPLEKVLGPVAALPSSTAVTTSPPSPEPETPSVTAAPPPVPPAEAKPASQPRPAETPAAEAKAPSPSEDASSPDREPNDTSTGPATTEEPPSESPSTETANITPPPSIPPGTTRFGIEIGSVAKQDEVRPLWKTLLTNHAALVAGLQARRVMGPDKKWRLIAGPFSSAAEAMQACGLFKKADMPCEATVFAGDAF